jgi:polysaccharide pyruvyl transferase WcaK-like protein
MNILITNAVPVNGGDEALLRATLESLRIRWPQSSVTVLCAHLDVCRKHLTDLSLASDLEFVTTDCERRRVSELYRKADVILSAPGGFLHDYYDIQDRLRGFEVGLALGKPLILLPQSIGPFWKPESLRRIPEVLNRVSCICVRDRVSKECLLRCGVRADKVRETADAAFLWRRLAPELFRPKDGPVRAVGLCFRAWPPEDDTAVQDTLAKAVVLSRALLADPSKNLVFLSTCQGIPGYIDDSLLALEIVNRLPPELRARCQVDRARYSPRQLVQQLGRLDLFIGMRLHACLLAMLAGVPAMGLGYEQKTREIFSELGMEKYQVPFQTDGDTWIRCAECVVNAAAEVRQELGGALDRLCQRADTALDAIDEALCRTSHAKNSSVTPDQPSSEWPALVTKYDVPHLRLRQVAALVQELRPERLVDLGCATGHLRQLCPGVEYIGCDFVAPAQPVSFPFYRCDFNRQDLPADLQELELVVCSGLLEYIEDLPAFLKRVGSRLKSEGVLIATYFNMNHISRIWTLLCGRSFPVRPDWRGLYSPRDVAAIIEHAGFHMVQKVAMNHSFKAPSAVDETTALPLTLPRGRFWSPLLSHQLLFVARRQPVPPCPRLQDITQVIPEGQDLILVDECRWGTEVAAGHRVIPFLEKDGQYWGQPADDGTAIRELERLRQAGAGFMVFAAPAFWWLEYYAGLHAHLRSKFRCVLENDRLVVFDLRS